MYQSFFELTKNPFEVSPDPYFLYPTPQHQEAVAGLYYGVAARKGFMVLTGEVGTGKTLVVRCLMDLFDQKGIAYSYVFYSQLSSRELLRYVAEDLGVPSKGDSKSSLLLQTSRHLIDRHRQGLVTALIVDEAQHLSGAVLEEIRLLTNLETPQGKLLQIMLVGQPELDATLESRTLRQLKQRVTLRFRLQPLSKPETYGYIQRRLELAGVQDNGIFPAETLQRVYSYSKGLPRLVNTLCDHAMLSAYSLGERLISPALIEEAASDLRLVPANGNSRRAKRAIPEKPVRKRRQRHKATTTQSEDSLSTSSPGTSTTDAGDGTESTGCSVNSVSNEGVG